MKSFSLVLALAAALSSALPVDQAMELEARQITTRNDLENGNPANCPQAILIYARGSTESGNMGITAGPVLASALGRQLDSVWIQGVGGAYKAELSPNFLPKGTNQASIDETKRLYTLAHTKCPNTPIVAAGYSQGTAVVGNAISEIDDAIKNKIVGAALFGYTKNLQNRAQIPNYPKDRTAIYCGITDAVCSGSLFILPAHFLYMDDAAGPAARFLAKQIKAF